eukprot:scaffold1236_cov170-Ochromonas_danica.AAC.17
MVYLCGRGGGGGGRGGRSAHQSDPAIASCEGRTIPWNAVWNTIPKFTRRWVNSRRIESPQRRAIAMTERSVSQAPSSPPPRLSFTPPPLPTSPVLRVRQQTKKQQQQSSRRGWFSRKRTPPEKEVSLDQAQLQTLLVLIEEVSVTNKTNEAVLAYLIDKLERQLNQKIDNLREEAIAQIDKAVQQQLSLQQQQAEEEARRRGRRPSANSSSSSTTSSISSSNSLPPTPAAAARRVVTPPHMK